MACCRATSAGEDGDVRGVEGGDCAAECVVAGAGPDTPAPQAVRATAAMLTTPGQMPRRGLPSDLAACQAVPTCSSILSRAGPRWSQDAVGEPPAGPFAAAGHRSAPRRPAGAGGRDRGRWEGSGARGHDRTRARHENVLLMALASRPSHGLRNAALCSRLLTFCAAHVSRAPSSLSMFVYEW